MSEKIYFGVDVCKESLAFCGPGVAGQVANNAPGQRRLLARLPKGAHLIIEASGGYERELVRMAQQSAVPVSVVNPRQVRDFARGGGAGWPRPHLRFLRFCGQGLLEIERKSPYAIQEH